jgi:hypothetical protein
MNITSLIDLACPRLQCAMRQGEVKELPANPEAAAIMLASTSIREVPAEPEHPTTRQDA